MQLSKFLTTEFDTLLATPSVALEAINFKRTTILENWEFAQFHRMRKEITEALTDPWSVRPVDDATGYGVKVLISDRQKPTSRVWDTLNDYMRSNGWLMFTHANVGFGKSRFYSGDVTLDRSEFITYEVVVYHQLKTISYCAKNNVYYVGYKLVDFIRELGIEPTHDVANARCTLSEQQVADLKEMGYVAYEV